MTENDSPNEANSKRLIAWPPAIAAVWLLIAAHLSSAHGPLRLGLLGLFIWVPTIPLLAVPLVVGAVWVSRTSNRRSDFAIRLLWYVVAMIYSVLAVWALMMISKG